MLSRKGFRVPRCHRCVPDDACRLGRVTRAPGPNVGDFRDRPFESACRE
jgi:hypothetical protein